MKIKQLINIFFVFAVCQISYLSAAKTALVSNFGDSSVTLFDTTTDTPLLNVSTGSGPVGSAITPNGKKGYVANNDDTVTVINLTTSPPTTITLNDPSFQFNGLQTIAITPDGSKAYIVNFLGNSVTVINTSDDTLNTIISGLFIAPLGIAITPDGNTALVANINNVTKIDLATNALSLITSTDFNSCEDIAVKPDGSTAYVTNFVNNKIVPIDLTTFVPGTAIDSLSSNFLIAINPSGTKAYVTTFFAKVPVIDLVNNALSNNILGLGTTSGVAFIPDGKKAYITDFSSSNVYPILVQCDIPQPPITGFLSPSFVAVIPDQAPTASFTFTAESSCSSIIFDASASSSPDGFIENYSWDFGDGNTVETSSPIIAHVYMTSGSFTVTLRVTNSQGTSTFQTFTGQTVSNNGGPTAVISQLINIAPLPPSNFIGIIKKNKFLNKTKCVLKAKWEASPSTNVVFYRIYKKGVVVEEVPATSPLVFKTCLQDCSGKGFEIAAVSSDNLESCHLKIRIQRLNRANIFWKNLLLLRSGVLPPSLVDLDIRIELPPKRLMCK